MQIALLFVHRKLPTTFVKVSPEHASILQKTWSDSKTQKGAFKVLSNAKKCADDNAGYSVFDEKGTVVYVGKNTAAKKTVLELAKEVIAGKWGNGQDRKNRLTASGYDYTAVQNKVNELLK